MLRRRIIADFERTAGRHDDPQIYGGPADDPGLLSPDSLSWRVTRASKTCRYTAKTRSNGPRDAGLRVGHRIRQHRGRQIESSNTSSTFIAAVRFSRDHPMLRRAAYTECALTPPENAKLLDMGSAFIAGHIHGDAPGKPTQRVRWVADVFARLFMTYIATPPTDPAFGDDELERFDRCAHPDGRACGVARLR
jgi:hypothetical protein